MRGFVSPSNSGFAPRNSAPLLSFSSSSLGILFSSFFVCVESSVDSVVDCGWKACETEASRCKRSNSACSSAGSFGGEGPVWKDVAARVRRGTGRVRREIKRGVRRRCILAMVVLAVKQFGVVV